MNWGRGNNDILIHVFRSIYDETDITEDTIIH